MALSITKKKADGTHSQLNCWINKKNHRLLKGISLMESKTINACVNEAIEQWLTKKVKTHK